MLRAGSPSFTGAGPPPSLPQSRWHAPTLAPSIPPAVVRNTPPLASLPPAVVRAVYTNVGAKAILISVNPYRWLDIYTTGLMREHYEACEL